jgi:asparagine synthase (glutamine-hydrolysing)
MDHELAQFAARLPDTLKVRGGTLRYIQRKLAARYLPSDILSRPKQGFSSALPYVLQAQYARLYDTCLSRSRLVADGILEGAKITALVKAHGARRADHGNRLWLLINAELWYRLAIRGESKADLSSELSETAAQPLSKTLASGSTVASILRPSTANRQPSTS